MGNSQGLRLFCALCFSAVLHAGAQHAVKDSLGQIIRNASTPDTARILALTEFSYLLRSENVDSTLLLAQQARLQARALNFLKGEGRALRLIGIYHKQIGENDQAMAYFDSALVLASKSNDRVGTASVKLNIGLVYQEAGNYQKALAYDFEALHVLERSGAKHLIAILNLNIGIVYLNQKIYDKAVDFFTVSLNTADSINEYRIGGLASGALGFIYGVKKDYDNAIKYQLNALRLMKKTRDIHGTTYPYNSLAEIYLSINQPDKAKLYLDQGMTMAEQQGYRDRVSDLKKTFAQYFYLTGNYNMAVARASEAQELARQVDHLELYKNATEQRYLAEIKLGKDREALKSFQLFTLLKDSMVNEESKQQSLMKDFAFKEEKLKLENKNLTLQSELKAEALQRTRLLLIVILCLAIVLAAFAINYYRSAHKNKKLTLEVQNQKEEIQTQAEELVQANEEIQRINEDLEEQVKFKTNQIISYASYNAHQVRGPLARIMGLTSLIKQNLTYPEELPYIVTLIDSSAKELDEIVSDINRTMNEISASNKPQE